MATGPVPRHDEVVSAVRGSVPDFEPTRPLRPLRWIASARRDYLEFPDDLQDQFGFQLYLVQIGLFPRSAKMLKGLGSGVVELAANFDGDAFRAVYTVRFGEVVYVLHSFKKKAKRGIKTPKVDVDLIRRRLIEAEADYASVREARKT